MVQLSTPGVTPNRVMGPREALFVKLPLVLYQTGWRYTDGNPLTGASNAGGV